MAVAVAIVLIVGGYFGLKYLGKRETAAQGQLAKAMSFYHGAVDPEATDDPFSKGAVPTFKSDADKYRAAAKEFSDIASGWGFDKVSIVAKYYLGLCQLQLGDKQEAAANLQSVANNSRQRTIGFLAKKVLAAHYLEEGNHANAQDIQGMIKDPQCDLPKEDLAIQLSQALAAQENTMNRQSAERRQHRGCGIQYTETTAGYGTRQAAEGVRDRAAAITPVDPRRDREKRRKSLCFTGLILDKIFPLI